MALQTSGAISLSQVQSEFGGSNPISMSEYYRGGSYVPTSITSAAGTYTSYYGTQSSPAYYWLNSLGTTIYWNGSQVFSDINTGAGATNITVGGYDYDKGTQFNYVAGSGKLPINMTYYRVRRRTSAGTATTVNTGIPSSGTIDMADFYGGRNS